MQDTGQQGTLLRAKIKEAQCIIDGKCTIYLIRIQLATGEWSWDYGVPVKCSWKRPALWSLLMAKISRQLKVLKWWQSRHFLKQEEAKTGDSLPSYSLQLHWCHMSMSMSSALQRKAALRQDHTFPSTGTNQHPSGLHHNCRQQNGISGKHPALLTLDKLYNISIYASLLKRLQYRNWHGIWHLWLTRVTLTLMTILASLW